MDAALAWSFERLTADERSVLTACARFESDFDLESVAAISGHDPGPVVGAIARLVNESLLQVTRSGGRARYRALAPIRDRVRAHSDVDADLDRRVVAHFVDVAARGFAKMTGHAPRSGVELFAAEIANLRHAFDIADGLDDVVALHSLAESLGFATGMTSQTLGVSALQQWSLRLEARLAGRHGGESGRSSGLHDELVRSAMTWTHAAAGNWDWLRQLPEFPKWGGAPAAAVAMAKFSSGDAEQAWAWFEMFDPEQVDDPALKVWASALGSLIALQRRDVDSYRRLRALVYDIGRERQSPMIQFYVRSVEASSCFAHGDLDGFERTLDRQVADIVGHGLLTLETNAKQLRTSGVAYALGRRDPVPLLIQFFETALVQNSLQPGLESLTLATVALVLNDRGRGHDAALVIGLLTRLGVNNPILEPERRALDAQIDADEALTLCRIDGQTSSTVDVYRRTLAALVGLAQQADVSESS